MDQILTSQQDIYKQTIYPQFQSIVVSNGLVSLDTSDSVNILVSNITDSPAHIQQGTQLAYIQPIQQASIDIAEAINDELGRRGLVKTALCAVRQADAQPEVDAFWRKTTIVV